MKYAIAYWDEYLDHPVSGMLMGGFWFERDLHAPEVRLYLPTIKNTVYLIERHLSYQRNVSATGCLHLPPYLRKERESADWSTYYDEFDPDEFAAIRKSILADRFVEEIPARLLNDPFEGDRPEVRVL